MGKKSMYVQASVCIHYTICVCVCVCVCMNVEKRNTRKVANNYHLTEMNSGRKETGVMEGWG